MSLAPVIGTTRRTTGDQGPLLHAATHQRRTQWSTTFRAWCGAGVYHRPDLGSFNPDHERACPRCAAKYGRTRSTR